MLAFCLGGIQLNVLGFIALVGTALFVIVAGIYTTVRPPADN